MNEQILSMEMLVSLSDVPPKKTASQQGGCSQQVPSRPTPERGFQDPREGHMPPEPPPKLLTSDISPAAMRVLPAWKPSSSGDTVPTSEGLSVCLALYLQGLSKVTPFSWAKLW